MLSPESAGHVIVEANLVEPQIRRGAPAHMLLVELVHPVDPDGLAAVRLPRGVQLDVEHDLLPRLAHQRNRRRALATYVSITALHVGPVGLEREREAQRNTQVKPEYDP